MPRTTATDSGAFIQPTNLVDQVADYLTQAIIGQRFAPGERLSEVQLARDLGVSRAPVREAARLLESRGLLVSKPRKGVFVRALDASELNDIYDMRLCLERHATERLSASFTDEIEASLRSQVERLCEAASHGDETQRIEEDLAFHRLMIAWTGNRRLLQSFDALSHELRLCITLITKTHEDPDSIADCHHLLLDALKSGDARRCREAVDYHIGVARDYVIKAVAESRT
ncbi:GntR family transcriptional regulator [Halomonas sp. TRM85114]|uniref:GntR family transcriptional regulator n=1 Tax=Halomonas jincaotanensis TaxID=2810616 RepID=UPI001BD28BA1|nr:GntR family transcriptional regulator [Halomonas jincaotanensis]MBS9402449.1 GntR family transcriptional regulator [Halomonas jincaotanensis]